MAPIEGGTHRLLASWEIAHWSRRGDPAVAAVSGCQQAQVRRDKFDGQRQSSRAMAHLAQGADFIVIECQQRREFAYPLRHKRRMPTRPAHENCTKPLADSRMDTIHYRTTFSYGWDT
jgi:hypothetical protein